LRKTPYLREAVGQDSPVDEIEGTAQAPPRLRRRVQKGRAARSKPNETKLSEILKIADEAFDSRDKALSWLREPNVQIGDERPIEVIGTVAGFRAVKTILRQIQYGVFG
jgi:putative toxin-antitoxin system antitoxin component (TIGR02293 family)